jgi:hypothetical protein
VGIAHGLSVRGRYLLGLQEHGGPLPESFRHHRLLVDRYWATTFFAQGRLWAPDHLDLRTVYDHPVFDVTEITHKLRKTNVISIKDLRSYAGKCTYRERDPHEVERLYESEAYFNIGDKIDIDLNASPWKLGGILRINSKFESYFTDAYFIEADATRRRLECAIHLADVQQAHPPFRGPAYYLATLPSP